MSGEFDSASKRCIAPPVAVVVGDNTADKLIIRLKQLVTKLCVDPSIQQDGEK